MGAAKLALLLLLGLLAVNVVVRAHDDEGDDHEGHDHGDEEEDAAPTGPSEVVVLDDTNFDDHVKANEITLIEFYAPWCGHCKALAPEYDKASILLSGKSKIAKVDCTEHRDLCEKYDVQGFPTIKLFRNDGSEPQDYDQARKADAIVKFMEKQKQPAYVTLKTQKEIDDFVADDGDIEVVAFVAEGDKASTDAFVAVAKALRNDYEFAIVTDAALAKSQPSAVLYRKFDEPQVTHTGEWTEEGLSNFVRGNAFPLVGEIGPENYQKYLERGYPLVWIFVDKDDKETIAAATEVAKDFRSSLSLVWLDGKRWADHAKTFGLSGKTPGLVVEDRENRKNYVFPESQRVTVEALRAHLKGFTEKTIQPTVKSEEIPEKNDGPVKVVVGKSFESIVLDTTKDVLIEFYAPWCGHCKSLTPKYEKVAASYDGEESIVIAKVDADKHKELGGRYGVKGFPTIKFFPKGNKDGEDYTAGREAEDFIKFINDKTGASRSLGGGFAESFGRIPSLDVLVEKFGDAEGDAKKAALSEIVAAVAALPADQKVAGAVYESAAKKVAEAGTEWATKEVARLKRMLDGGSVAGKKKAEFARRKNIVSAFDD